MAWGRRKHQTLRSRTRSASAWEQGWLNAYNRSVERNGSIPPVDASKLSAAIGRIVLRAGNYPLRGAIGHWHREQSRRRGGRRMKVELASGERLDAWYSPRSTRLGDRSMLPIVFSHGILEVKERHFRFADRLNAMGHDVILYDHRSHGRSGGMHVTFGVQERDDLRRILDTAIQRQYIDERVVTIGFSLGGGSVLQHASVDERVAGVVAVAPFGDFRAAIRTFRDRYAPWLDDEWLLRGFNVATAEAGFEVEQASAVSAIARIACPVLLVAAGRDPVLPPCHHTQTLLDAGIAGDVTCVTVDRATHMTIMRKRWPVFDDALDAFLKRIA